MDALANISKAIALAKKLLEVNAISQNADAMLSIANLQLELAGIKSALSDLMHENQSLKEKLQAKQNPPDLSLRDGAYYKTDGDGPYCTTCFDSSGKLIRLTRMADTFAAVGKWRCGACKSLYGGKGA